MQAALFSAAGLALWMWSGREPVAFVDWSWRAMLQGVVFAGLLIASAATAFCLFPRFLEHTTQLQAKLAKLLPRDCRWPLVVWISLCAGIGEEALFRGGIQTLAGDHLGVGPAIALSAAGFALVHLAKPLITAIILLIGVIFGIVYWWTGSLLTVVIGHVLYDIWALRVLHRELVRLGHSDTPPAAAD
ncbi:MAG: lysostaphin resistance A-like protein [Cypionkella sp.]